MTLASLTIIMQSILAYRQLIAYIIGKTMKRILFLIAVLLPIPLWAADINWSNPAELATLLAIKVTGYYILLFMV